MLLHQFLCRQRRSKLPIAHLIQPPHLCLDRLRDAPSGWPFPSLMDQPLVALCLHPSMRAGSPLVPSRRHKRILGARLAQRLNLEVGTIAECTRPQRELRTQQPCLANTEMSGADTAPKKGAKTSHVRSSDWLCGDFYVLNLARRWGNRSAVFPQPLQV